MPAETRLFPCLNDNYGVLVHDSDTGATASIDAPEAAPVEAALKATGWKLTDILVTHHHADHTGGIQALKDKYKCRVVAPAAEAAKIPAVDETVREGDKVTVGKLSANVIETPGHTLRPHRLLVSCRQTRLRRRYAVFHRLRPGDRRHAGNDVAFAGEACATCRTTPKFIAGMNTPPPISASPAPSSRTIRCWPRARRKRSGRSRRASRPSPSPSATRNWPIRSCAPISPKSPPANLAWRQAGGAGVCRNPRTEKQVLTVAARPPPRSSAGSRSSRIRKAGITARRFATRT